MNRFILVITAAFFGVNFFLGYTLGYFMALSKPKIECPFPQTQEEMQSPPPVCAPPGVSDVKG
jgi:hypothetical protein